MKTFRNLLILFFTINFYATDLNYTSYFFNKDSILNFELDVNMEDEIKVEYEKADKYIWVRIKNKEFFDGLDRMLTQKNLKPLAVNSFFGPIFIDAIRRISDDENQLLYSDYNSSYYTEKTALV